jgi:hypothetical protein
METCDVGRSSRSREADVFANIFLFPNYFIYSLFKIVHQCRHQQQYLRAQLGPENGIDSAIVRSKDQGFGLDRPAASCNKHLPPGFCLFVVFLS